jgi:hypothetical protein
MLYLVSTYKRPPNPDVHLSLLMAYRLKEVSLTNSETSRKLGFVL